MHFVAPGDREITAADNPAIARVCSCLTGAKRAGAIRNQKVSGNSANIARCICHA